MKTLTTTVPKKKTSAENLYSDQYYNCLFDQSCFAIVVHDTHGKILNVNKRAIELFGYDASEFSRINIKDLHPHYELARSKTEFEKIRRR